VAELQLKTSIVVT